MKNTQLIHEVRAVKSKKELANIIKAQRITEQVMQEAVRKLTSGISEIQIANFIKKSFTKHGAPILAFPPIVAFGKNTANIHHEPNKTKLKRGDTVMFDIGTTVNHYCSDMTRTYFWGEPNSNQKKIYVAVLKAQELAMAKIKQGERRGGVIDKVARSFLAKRFPDNPASTRGGSSTRGGFKHGLGHGVGTVIHEWPNFKPKSVDIIPAGCVMTVEPGLYFKGSRHQGSGRQVGGVRIEDMVLITKSGYKLLTRLPSDLKSVILK